MVNMTSSANDSQNSTLNSSIEQKKEYHKLLERFSQLGNDSVDNKERINTTMQVLTHAQTLITATPVDTSTVLLDSCVLRQAGWHTVTATTKIEANSNVYNPVELAKHIAENQAWWRFGLPRRVASAATLHGAFEPAPPPPRARAPRRRTQPQRQAALRKPEDNIVSTEKPQEDTAKVEAVHRWMREQNRRRGPLSLWHCVLDPGSFARTVHCVYYVAFLVQEGKVHVYLDEKLGIPMVRTVAPAQRAERDISQENQFIVSMDMALWKQLVEVCGIKKPLMNVDELTRK